MREEFCNWLREHSVEPRACYKIELVESPNDTDPTWMVVHCYKLDEDGNKIIRGAGKLHSQALPGDGEPETEIPRTVTLLSPLPDVPEDAE